MAHADFRFGACCSANGGVCGCKNGGAICCDGQASTCACNEKDFKVEPPISKVEKDTASAIPAEHVPYLPNSKLTPGDARSKLKDEICAAGYIKSVGRTTSTQKDEVFKRYGIVRRGDYDIDHLISKGLGGSKDMKNLYPQPLKGPWNMQKKDQLENHLHRLVCSGKLDLSLAQREIAHDWIAAYKKYEPAVPTAKKPKTKSAKTKKKK